MGDINVVSRTQRIHVDMASSSVAVINAGPQGPATPNVVTALSTVNKIYGPITQAAYDLLDPPAEDTLYLIVD